jgi:hypothetical protein
MSLQAVALSFKLWLSRRDGVPLKATTLLVLPNVRRRLLLVVVGWGAFSTTITTFFSRWHSVFRFKINMLKPQGEPSLTVSMRQLYLNVGKTEGGFIDVNQIIILK